MIRDGNEKKNIFLGETYLDEFFEFPYGRIPENYQNDQSQGSVAQWI